MTDHDGKLNAVQRIEMKIILALGAEAPHHVTGDRRAVELPRHGIVVLDAAEALIEQPFGNFTLVNFYVLKRSL